jgi:hypothetical protein
MCIKGAVTCCSRMGTWNSSLAERRHTQAVFGLPARHRVSGAEVAVAALAAVGEEILRAAAFRHQGAVALGEEAVAAAVAVHHPPEADRTRLAVAVELAAEVIPREISSLLDYLVAWDWRAMLRAMFPQAADPRPDVLALRRQEAVAARAAVEQVPVRAAAFFHKWRTRLGPALPLNPRQHRHRKLQKRIRQRGHRTWWHRRFSPWRKRTLPAQLWC